MGFSRPPSWSRALLVGTLAGLAIELCATFVTTPALSWLTGVPPDLSSFRSVVGNARALLFFLVLNWTLFAIGEELAFRGYVMNLFADALGKSQSRWMVSLVVTSALFGWGHGNQGVTGIAQETLSGLLLGGVYLVLAQLAMPPRPTACRTRWRSCDLLQSLPACNPCGSASARL